MAMAIPSGRVRFGGFEVDLRSGELRKQGIKIKLHDQPFQVLAMLLEHPGELVTREQLHQKLWPTDTFVDFDVGLNSAIKRLRDALGDTAESPRYVETLPRRGYRFLATVENGAPAPAPASPLPVPTLVGVQPSTEATPKAGSAPVNLGARRSRVNLWVGVLALAGLLAAVLGLNIGGWRQRLLRAPVSERIQSIAVLPLENLSGDPEQEYFADGMTEALITDLGKIGQLRVISRTSVTRYKGTKKPLQEIARELQVDALVEGTVARSGDHVRITANLVQASPEKHLWADSFERNLGDVLALQDEVSRAIANGIQIRLTPQEQVRLASARRVNPEAYQSYLRGLYFWNKLTPDSVKIAVNYFQTAIEKDPGYAPAYGSLADCYSWGYLELNVAPREAFSRARIAATKAAALDENLAEAHVALGNVSEREWDLFAAERQFRRAIQLDPNQSYAHLAYGFLLLILHKPDDAWTELKTAQSLDPVSQATGVAIVISLNYSHRYDEALTVTKQWLQLYPDSFVFHTFLGDTYVQKGMESLAITEYLKAEELLGSGPSRIAALQKASRTSGLSGFWKQKLALDQDPRSPQFSAYDVAHDYAALQDRENSLLWLEKSYKDKDQRLIELGLDPRFDVLRSDPRFQDLLRRIGLPP